LRVYNLTEKTLHIEKLIEGYNPEVIDLSKYKWAFNQFSKTKSKNKSVDNLRIIAPPISMGKMINLLDLDEYHYACVDAISESCFVKFECKHPKAKSFFENIQLPVAEDLISIMSDFVHYYIACGNSFFLKMRNLKGEWVGLNRLIPREVMIAENYDDYGFLKPDYLQVKSGQKTFFFFSDIIHLLQRNSLSNAWGLACKPIILNIETLYDIKQYDFNRFKNGLLIDYFIIIEGGVLGERYTEIDEKGKEKIVDPYKKFLELLGEAKGIKNAHGSIFIETADANSKVRLEPMRINDNNFGELKKDLREGIIVYHRVPHRLISQETPGRLGGDNNSDLVVFYNMVVKPLQERVATILTREFNNEFNWGVKIDDFDFGNIAEVLENIESKLFR
jgi:capsid portal protein